MAFETTSISQALAHMGSPGLMPAVSSSWVFYPVVALSSLLGTGRLSPAVDVDSLVINVKSGYVRKNKSWILGRFLRDWDYKTTTQKGLYVTIIDAVTKKEHGKIGSPSFPPSFTNYAWRVLTLTM